MPPKFGVFNDAKLYAVNPDTGERTELSATIPITIPNMTYEEGSDLDLTESFKKLREGITIELEDVQFFPKPKRINDLKEAADYAYGLSETRKEIAELLEVRDDQMAKLQAQMVAIEEWYSTVANPLQDKAEYFETLLSDFHQRQYQDADGDKAKKKVTSIKLPYGITLSSRSQQTQLEVTDPDALFSYARDAGYLTTPAPQPKWADIKKTLQVHEDGRVFDANGEEVPFVQAKPQDRKFEVK